MSSEFPFLSESGEGHAVLALHVQPGSRKSAIVGLHGDRLKIKIKAPPVEGQANEEIRRFLADLLNLPIKCVKIISGEQGRQKRVLVEGLGLRQMRDILSPLVQQEKI